MLSARLHANSRVKHGLGGTGLGGEGAQVQSGAWGTLCWPSPDARSSAFLQTQFPNQLLLGDKADKIQVHGFQLAFAGPPVIEQHQQQRGNQRAVELQGHSALRLSQPVAGAQDDLEPFEEQLDLPTVVIDPADEFGRQVLPAGDQDKNFARRLNFHHPDHRTPVPDAQAFPAIGNHPGRRILHAHGPHRSHRRAVDVVGKPQHKINPALLHLPQETVVVAIEPVGHIKPARLNLALERAAFANLARGDGPVFGHLVQHRKMQMQLNGTAVTGRRCPHHAIERAQRCAVHQGQGFDRLPHAGIAKLHPPFGLLGQFPQNGFQDLWPKHMLGFRKTSGRHGPRAHLAHALKPTAGITQSAHGFKRRIEQGKEQQAEIILRQHLPPRIVLAGTGGGRRQVRSQSPMELMEQPPVAQLVFLQFGVLGCHALSKPYLLPTYKLQSGVGRVTNSLRHTPPQQQHPLCRTLLQIKVNKAKTAQKNFRHFPTELRRNPAPAPPFHTS